MRFAPVGVKASQCLRKKTILVVGCGALGSAAASLIVRSGVGKVRLVDRDIVDTSNLGDQCLYTDRDARQGLPKAKAAARHLATFNRNVEIETFVADFGPNNAETLFEGIDLVIDAVDNLKTKYLINDAAVATDTPWVYGGCAGSQGTVLAVVPGQTLCLRCIWPTPPPAVRVDDSESMGLFPATPSFVAAIQVTEALKILLDRTDELIGGPIHADLWRTSFRKVPVSAFQKGSGQCPACGERNFVYLHNRKISPSIVVCGHKTILINPGRANFDYQGAQRRVAERLSVVRDLDHFRFQAGGYRFLVLSSGRVLIHGTNNPSVARSLCERYLFS